MKTLPVNYYELLLDINIAISKEVTPQDLFDKLSEILRPIIDFTRFSLRIYNQEYDKMEWFSRATGLIINDIDIGTPPQDGSMTKEAVLTKKTILVENLKNNNQASSIKKMVNAGLVWSVAIPLISRQKSFGAFCFSFSEHLKDEDHLMILFLEKMTAQVSTTIENIMAQSKLHEINQALIQKNKDLVDSYVQQYDISRYFYKCQKMQTVVEQAKIISQCNLPVLLLGETGTGKDFLARFIHNSSLRRYENFVKINCPALAPSLFESELFGHAKGSFTGAVTERKGRFELANNGSIFLDEIADLDPLLQAKLLQVIQESKFEKVGQSNSISVDVRFISATNLSIESLIEEKKFRQDLYYRLGAAIITIPPLRERIEELPELINHIIKLESEELNCLPISFNNDAIELLQTYSFPGNIRELTNLIKRLLILNSGNTLTVQNILPLLVQPSAKKYILNHSDITPINNLPQHNLPEQQLYIRSDEQEKIQIINALKQTNGMISGVNGAIQLLGISRSTLLRRIKKYQIKVKDFTIGKK